MEKGVLPGLEPYQLAQFEFELSKQHFWDKIFEGIDEACNFARSMSLW